MDREQATVIEVQRHDLEHVPRTVRPEVEAANRRLGLDVVAEHSMSDRVPDVAILDPVPSGTGVDTDLAHSNTVLRNCEVKRGSGSELFDHSEHVDDPPVDPALRHDSIFQNSQGGDIKPGALQMASWMSSNEVASQGTEAASTPTS